ncbi:MAG: stage III sporulation protein AA [Tepidanaerobacteraceae bacterium]|jgi:stage III sporulation protein AA
MNTKNIHSGLKGKIINEIFPILPFNIKRILKKIPGEYLLKMEEIRIRQARPLMVVVGNEDFLVSEDGDINTKEGYVVTKEDVIKTLQLISQNSIYAVEDEIKNGYITVSGGHRVGLAGKALLEGNKIKTLKHISCFNIRIAREIQGVADTILPHIIDNNKRIYSTLIISPPKAGKTTLLRDIIRQLSYGVPRYGVKGFKIGLVDERSEIACCHEGVPQNDVGIRTDIIDSCPKELGIMMLLRSMSPEIIATDEIGKPEDAHAIEEALNAGVTIITTAHGSNLDEMERRPTLKRLIELNVFNRFLILGFTKGVGSLEKVISGEDFSVLYDLHKGVT